MLEHLLPGQELIDRGSSPIKHEIVSGKHILRCADRELIEVVFLFDNEGMNLEWQ